ncbi:MAG TPA: PRC-barrel domain-containing protein, partial [Chroococcidiopsis sp.]
MTTQRPTTLQYSDLIGRLVLDRSTADELGHVDQLWLDPGNYRVSGFTCKSGVLGHRRRSFHWSQIASLGADGILVQSAAVEPAKPDTIAAVIGHEVWTDAGSKAGVVKDYQIAMASGQVLSYLFVSNGWRAILDGLYALPPQAILSIGPKR